MVVLRGAQILANAGVRTALALAGYQVLMAFLIAMVVAVPAGMAIGLYRAAHRVFNPIILLLFGVPQVTVLPLFVLGFGTGNAPKIAFGATHAVFPILLLTMGGGQAVDPRLVEAARSMGARPLEIFAKAVLPWVTPAVITGMRLGVVAALLGVLLAEFWVSQRDLGHYVMLYTSSFKPAELLALVGLIALLAILISGSLRQLERRLSRWRG